MKKTTKYIALSLATYMTLSPLAVKAETNENLDIIPISAPIIDKEVQIKDYINYEGKIVEIKNDGDKLSMLIKADDDEYGLILHINEDVILLNHKTKDFTDKDKLKEGMTITAYYAKYTPMLLSLPGQLTPGVIVVKESEEPSFIKVSGFNEDLVSGENDLKLNISEDTVIVNKDGEKVEKEDIKDKDLIVFYTASTKSIPAQTTPEKIIVIKETLKEENVEITEITALDKIIIDGKEVKLTNLIYTNDEGIKMIPLRQIAEALGYEVKWNNKARSAELTKGAQYTSIVIGEDNYNFAKMLIKLGTAPEFKDSTSYVPISFLEEVLKLGVEITKEGIINIGL